MHKRIYSDIAKFKAIEASLRRATNELRSTMELIDSATVRKSRTDEEVALLRSTRDQVAKLRQDAQDGRNWTEM